MKESVSERMRWNEKERNWEYEKEWKREKVRGRDGMKRGESGSTRLDERERK